MNLDFQGIDLRRFSYTNLSTSEILSDLKISSQISFNY